MLSNLLQGFIVRPMTVEDVQEAVQMHVETSMVLNPLWLQFPSDKEDLLVDFRARMTFQVQDGLSWVLRDEKTNQLVTFLVQIDAFSYINSKESFPHQSNLLKLQGKYDDQLENQYLSTQTITARGQIIDQTYLSIRQQYAQGGIASQLFFHVMEEVRQNGYNEVIARSTNIVSANYFVKVGGKFIEEVKFPTNEGEKTFIWLVSLPLSNYPPLKAILATLAEKSPTQPSNTNTIEESKSQPFDFKKQLAETANKLASAGQGILAADESESTIGQKFVTIGVENTVENRRAYRELLFTTPEIEQYISGVILFSETAKQTTQDNVQFIELLQSQGIISGIKVDKGLGVLPGTNDENTTKGLDSLEAMAKEYYDMGCRFAKWRAVLKIGDGCPSNLSIQENAWGLARYAAICQQNGLVPIVEPEILSDGDHSIEVCQQVTEKVLAAVTQALSDNNIFLQGCLLKPNMVTPGSKFPNKEKITSEEIGIRTATALSRTIPPSMVAVFFLSGGQSQEQASLNLNSINKIKGIRKPWTLSFSYGRALQNTAVKTWHGKEENVQKAQEELLKRAKANSQAQLGNYLGSQDSSSNESLYVENYKY